MAVLPFFPANTAPEVVVYFRFFKAIFSHSTLSPSTLHSYPVNRFPLLVAQAYLVLGFTTKICR